MLELRVFSKKTKFISPLIFFATIILLIVLSCSSLIIGRLNITISELFDFIIGKPVPQSVIHVIIKLRLPRMLGAISVGAALSISGLIYQNIFQNPLVSPDLLGVSSGACVGAAFAIISGLGNFFVTLFSFGTGILSVIICIALSMLTKNRSNMVLVFAGIIIGRFMDSLVGIMKFFADPESELGDIVNWQLGTLSKVNTDNVLIIIIMVLLCMFIACLYRWRLNILSVGENEASALGINVTLDRIILIALSTLLTAISVCFCGTISWIGLIIPHVTRWLIGNDNRLTIPLCMLLGSNFMLLTDLLARATTDFELPIGVITGLCGAPIFAFIMIKKAKGEWNDKSGC